MSNFTGESGTVDNKVYERLRKRSYRRSVRWHLALRDHVLGDGEMPRDLWHDGKHAAYVRGVKDALSELRELEA